MAATRTPGVAALVERQATRWTLSQRLGRPDAPVQVSACIGVSRLAYAEGDAVSEHVAALLDFGLFGSDVLQALAREHGTPEWMVAGLDERMRGVLERYVADVFRRHPVTEDDYMRQVLRTVSTIGQRGRAVLVGRGAPFLLAASHTLRVLIAAPRAARLARCAAALGVSPDDARDRLASDDQRREQFVAHYFRVRQDDPTLYDVVVNTEHLSVDGAAGTIVAAFHARFPQVAAAAGTRAG